jgi:hypothetical protein
MDAEPTVLVLTNPKDVTADLVVQNRLRGPHA